MHMNVLSVGKKKVQVLDSNFFNPIAKHNPDYLAFSFICRLWIQQTVVVL